MIWVLLIPACMCFLIGAWASYTRKEAWWFIPVFLTLQLFNGILWVITTKIATPRDLLTIGVIWDLFAIAAYMLLPLVMGCVVLSPRAWAGVGLILFGVILVKTGG